MFQDPKVTLLNNLLCVTVVPLVQTVRREMTESKNQRYSI